MAGLGLFALSQVNPVFGPAGGVIVPGQALPFAGLDPETGQPLPPAPESDPAALVQISADDALARNAALPIVNGANPAAAAFRLSADEISRMRSIDCLAAAVYYEAGLEPTDGQRAVAQVVLNRVRHPAYPNSVCGVVFQGSQRTTGCQFTFTCDGALRRTPVPALFERARRVAEAALNGYVYAPVGWATHYHANYVFPYWAPTLNKVATIGTHIFYRWDSYGRGVFANRYAGVEPAIAWRGGFGQQGRDAEAALDSRDAAAAAAAEAARTGEPHSIDSFQRAVLRRYEPLARDSANQIIQERTQAQATSASSRWALTGQSSGTQQPLGRRPEASQPAQPVELDGVRRRPGAATPTPTPPAAAAAPAAPATEAR